MPIVEFLLIISLAFLGCLSAAYLLGRLVEGLRSSVTPLEGGVVRIKCTHGVYRSRFLGLCPGGWRLTAPLSRDAYVPFRPGDAVVLEAPVTGAAVLARSLVVERDMETHEIVVARPRSARRIERRETRRTVDLGGQACKLDDRSAALLDVSRHGARLVSSAAVSVGERVRLDLPGRDEPSFGWVLEVQPGESGQTVARVRFEND